LVFKTFRFLLRSADRSFLNVFNFGALVDLDLDCLGDLDCLVLGDRLGGDLD